MKHLILKQRKNPEAKSSSPVSPSPRAKQNRDKDLTHTIHAPICGGSFSHIIVFIINYYCIKTVRPKGGGKALSNTVTGNVNGRKMHRQCQ